MTGNDAPHEPDVYLAQRIHEALATGPTAELGVEVTVVGDAVVLAGTVGTDEQRAQLADIATSVAEGRSVRNDVAVVHGLPDHEPEPLA